MTTTEAPAADPRVDPAGPGSTGQDAPPPPAPRRSGRLLRRLGGTLLVLALAASALFGANVFGIRDRVAPPPAMRAAPLAHGVSAAGGQPVLASTPYWVGLTRLQGSGSSTQPLVISSGALQWRFNWSCEQPGHLLVRTPGATGPPRSRVDAACPGRGTAYASRTGTVPVEVTASAAWSLDVEQQIDLPVDQPPLAAMSAAEASVVSSGSFYGVDEQAHGGLTLYRLADGSHAIRLEGFYVTPNTGLELRFDTQASPHSDQEAAAGSMVSVVPLDVTAGSLNLAVPRSVDPGQYHSVLVWCVQIQNVYAAAALRPGPRAGSG